MRVQVLTTLVVAVVLAGRASADTKLVTPYSLPDVVVVGGAPAKTVSYVQHTAPAPLSAVRSAAFHYAVPHSVQYVGAAPAVGLAAAPAVGIAAAPAVQYTVPRSVQYVAAAPAVEYAAAPALQYAAVPAVRSAATVYSATFSQPAATVVREVESVEDVGVASPLAYAAPVVTRDVSLERGDDGHVRLAVPYGYLKEDHFDHDDSNDRK